MMVNITQRDTGACSAREYAVDMHIPQNTEHNENAATVGYVHGTVEDVARIYILFRCTKNARLILHKAIIAKLRSHPDTGAQTITSQDRSQIKYCYIRSTFRSHNAGHNFLSLCTLHCTSGCDL